MMKPKNLDAEASAFWTRHAKRLKDQGLLTDATYDSFVLLARIHSVLSRLDPDSDVKTGVIKLVALTRTYQALARGFGMNSDKPKVAESVEEADEFGITA